MRRQTPLLALPPTVGNNCSIQLNMNYIIRIIEIILLCLLSISIKSQQIFYGSIYNHNNCPINKGFNINLSNCHINNLTIDSTSCVSFQADCDSLNEIRIDFSDALNTEYYPIIIKEVDNSCDSIYVGYLPLIKDTFGYWTEWGYYPKTSLFDRKVQFYSTSVVDIPGRLLYEQDFSDLYKSLTNISDTIFQTITVYYINTKKNKSCQKTRYLILNHEDLMNFSRRLLSKIDLQTRKCLTK